MKLATSDVGTAQLFQHIRGLSPTSQFSPLAGAGGNAPTRGAEMPIRPSAVGEALALASFARCREVTWLVRATAGVANMAAAISAADGSFMTQRRIASRRYDPPPFSATLQDVFIWAHFLFDSRLISTGAQKCVRYSLYACAARSLRASTVPRFTIMCMWAGAAFGSTCGASRPTRRQRCKVDRLSLSSDRTEATAR